MSYTRGIRLDTGYCNVFHGILSLMTREKVLLCNGCILVPNLHSLHETTLFTLFISCVLTIPIHKKASMPLLLIEILNFSALPSN